MRGFAAALAGLSLLGGAVTDDPIVVYYYTQWSVWIRDFCPSQLFKEGHFRGVTHIQYAFHAPDQNCNIMTMDLEADFGGNGWQLPCEIECIGDIPYGDRVTGAPGRGSVGCFQKLAKEHNFQVGISLGGWTLSTHFSTCVSTPANREKFITSIVAEVDKYGWDFVDFDWEYPYGGGNDGWIGKQEDWENFETFILDLKKRSNVKLAAAVGMNPNLLQGTGNYHHPTPMKFLCDELEYVSLMNYDYMGGWDRNTGWPAPIYHDPEAKYEMADKLTIEWGLQLWKDACGANFKKVVMGLPSYGKSWRDIPAGPDGNGLYERCEATTGGPPAFPDMPCIGDGSFRESAGTLEIWDIHLNYLQDNRCTHYFHDVAKQDFVYCPEMYHSGSGPIWFAYDGPEVFFEKTRMARSMGAGGFMIWEPGYVELMQGADWHQMPGNKGSVTPAKLSAHSGKGYFWKEYEDAMFDGWNGGNIEDHRSKGQRVGDGSHIQPPPTNPPSQPEPTTPAAPERTTAPVPPGLADCHDVVSASVDGSDIHESCLMSYCTHACAHFVSGNCASNPSQECVADQFAALPPVGKIGISCTFASM